MFQDLTEKFELIVKKLRGHGKITESNVAESMREIRRVLLEADVNYKVAKQFIADVQEKALGQQVIKSITPGQMVVKIINDELTRLMGEKDVPLAQSRSLPPTVIMLVGLQGSGKTTLAGKLAKFVKQRNQNPILVAADVRRPAAIEQLKIVGKAVGVPVIADISNDPVEICREAVRIARKNSHDLVIFDTAGRLHVDAELMQELVRIKDATHPHEILFVADGMTGQDAVNTASEFLKQLDFSGVVLTKMDGDARGGAALSIRSVTGKPIKFLSVGEKYDQLEKFHPDRMASRILGMGDIVSLVEKAQNAVDQETALKMEKKLRRQDFTLEDFLEQLAQVKKMGPLEQIIGMIPGVKMNALKDFRVDDSALVRIEAMINSMTRDERRRPHIIDGSRRRRIARGSGTSVQDVNRLLNQFKNMQKMIKQMSRIGPHLGRGRMQIPF